MEDYDDDDENGFESEVSNMGEDEAKDMLLEYKESEVRLLNEIKKLKKKIKQLKSK